MFIQHSLKKTYLLLGLESQTIKRLAKGKLEKEKKLENKTEEEIEVIVNYEIALEGSNPLGEKPKYFGPLLVYKKRNIFLECKETI